jgi:tripartite-type tricarboxylate transporter receptor subunit TctC
VGAVALCGENVMKLDRRAFFQLATSAAIVPVLARTASTLDYPTRPVHLIVGYPPGGAADTVARLLGHWLSQRLGQPFIVENRPGAANNIATEVVARAPRDGYTLLVATSSNTVNPALYSNLNFNFIRDIAMVAGLSHGAIVLVVNPALPVRSVPELIAYVKAHPGEINLASPGTGTLFHVAGVLFRIKAGIEMTHVPYRGSAPMMIDLLAGQVQSAFDTVQSSIAYIKQGKLRTLAVTTASRSPSLPDVPTLGEFLPGCEANGWIGIGAPRGTPADVIEKLNKEINAALADPHIVARLTDLASTPFIASPGDLDNLVIEDTDRWDKVIRAAGIKIG